MALPDQELVARARAGSLAAFDALVTRHHQRVYVLACRILGNPEDAADVRQETFLSAWRSLPKFRDQCAFTTWLHRITVNLCLSRKSRPNWNNRSLPLDEDRIHTSMSGATTCIERVETTIAARQMLANMAAEDRVLLVLREMEELSYEEIAHIVGCSVDSIKNGLRRARRRWMEMLRAHREEESV